MKSSHYWSDFVEQQTWKFLWSDGQAPSAPHWFPLSLLNRPELVSFMCCSTERCVFASLWRKHTRTRVWNPPQPLSNHRSQIVDRIKTWGFSFSWIQNVNWMISETGSLEEVWHFYFGPSLKSRNAQTVLSLIRQHWQSISHSWKVVSLRFWFWFWFCAASPHSNLWTLFLFNEINKG